MRASHVFRDFKFRNPGHIAMKFDTIVTMGEEFEINTDQHF